MDPSLYTEIGKAFSYGLNENRGEGLTLLKSTEAKMKERGVTDAEAMYKIGQAYAVLGDETAALRMLSLSIKGGFFCYPYLKDDPLLVNIRARGEFAGLLESARNAHEEFKNRFMTAGSRQ